MTSPKPEYQNAALRLIADAATRRDDAAAIAGATERVFQGLHEHLARLVGVIGWRTLIARSLKLARAEHPTLVRLEVKTDGTIAGFAAAFAAWSPEEALAAPAALLAQLLDLLAAFVGEDLAIHLVHEATRRAVLPEGSRGPGDEGSVDSGRSEH